MSNTNLDNLATNTPISQLNSNVDNLATNTPISQVNSQVNSNVNSNVNNTQVSKLSIKPSDLLITNQHVEQLVDAIKEILNGKSLTPLNILRVANTVFCVACGMDDLPHRLQQTVILNALDNIIDQQTDMSELDKETLQQMLLTIIPEALNIASDIKSGLISFKKNNTCCVIA
jgi:hypothetical protein